MRMSTAAGMVRLTGHETIVSGPVICSIPCLLQAVATRKIAQLVRGDGIHKRKLKMNGTLPSE